MGVEIDGVLKEWGDRLYYTKVKSRRPKRNKAGFPVKPSGKAGAGAKPAGSGAGQRQRIKATTKRVPEVMVKITQGRKDPATGRPAVPCKDMKAIKAHLDYISRNGEVALEDEFGHQIHGREAVRELRDDWQQTAFDGIPYEDGKRREAFSIVLSMPPGTDREGVLNAAREFARDNFSNHQYVFAAHNDEAHPHVHLCVKTQGRDMTRLNPRKADIQEWRESFAERLREHGIEANATPRRARGITEPSQHQAIRHIERGEKPRESLAKRQWKGAEDRDVAAGKVTPDDAEPRIQNARKLTNRGYGAIARALAQSADPADRQLAVEIVGFVKQMPQATTVHRQRVEERLRQSQTAGGQGREPERTRPPERDRDPER